MKNKCTICPNQINSNNNICSAMCRCLFHFTCFIQQCIDFRCPTCNCHLIPRFLSPCIKGYDPNNEDHRYLLQQAYASGYMDNGQVTTSEFFSMKQK